MTNEEKLYQIFPDGICPFSKVWLSEEYREPTTKNNLGVDCISRKAALDITWNDPSYSDPLNVLTEVRDKIRELPSVTLQEPKFIAKSDGTIEQIKNCNDCVFRKEWEKIGKLLSVVLEKQTEQEPKTGHWIPTYGNVKCSVCGSVKDSREVGKATHYCDFCGARMVEPQERSEKE